MSSSLSLTNRRSLRHTFGVLSDTVDMPNLIAIQRSSYQEFLDSQSETSQKNEIGIIWNDSSLKIKWPIKNPLLSKKDKQNLTFKEFLKK